MKKIFVTIFALSFSILLFSAVPTMDDVGGSNISGGGASSQAVSANYTIYLRANTSDVETGHNLTNVSPDGSSKGSIFVYYWSQTPNTNYTGYLDYDELTISNFTNSSNNYCTFDVTLPAASSIPGGTTLISYYFGLVQTNNPPPPFIDDFGDREASAVNISTAPTNYYTFMVYAYDSVTEAPTLDLPLDNATIPQNFTVQYDQPETAYAGSVKLTFTRTGGTADTGSPHVLEVVSETSGTDKTISLDGGTLNGSTSVNLVTGGNTLVDDAIYNIKIEYQDIGLNPIASDLNAGITYDDDDLIEISGGDYNAGTSFSPGSTNNAFFRIQMQKTGGGASATVDKIEFDILGSFDVSDIDLLKIWRSTDNSFDSGSDTQLVSEATNIDPFIPDFSPDEPIGSTTVYYFLTVDVSTTASQTDEIGAEISTRADVYASIMVSGNFPITGSTHPLPVTLSSFTVQLQNQPSLNWTTQSETNNAYWNIYRGISQNLGQATYLNEDNFIAGAGTITEPTSYTYTDNYPISENTTYWYWLECVDNSGESNILGPISLFVPEGNGNNGTPITPDDYGLKQNYPNPFNPNTRIDFALDYASKVQLIVYNIKGEKIKTIFEGYVPNDGYLKTKYWNGKDESGKNVATGVYLYTLKTNKEEFHRRMLLMK